MVSGLGFWIGCLIEWFVLWLLIFEFELGSDFGGLNEWVKENVVKVLCFCYLEDDVEM